jgi:hypothetical protein
MKEKGRGEGEALPKSLKTLFLYNTNTVEASFRIAPELDSPSSNVPY